MENIGKILVEKFCKHRGYGDYSVDEDKLIEAINKAVNEARNTKLENEIIKLKRGKVQIK